MDPGWTPGADPEADPQGKKKGKKKEGKRERTEGPTPIHHFFMVDYHSGCGAIAIS